MEAEFTDRYQALGIPYPEPATVCLGHCEGTGMVPVCGEITKARRRWCATVRERESDPQLLAAWDAQHRFTCGPVGRVRNFIHGLITFDRYRLRMATERCDGWHFVKCPTCKGTGKRDA